MNILLQLRFDHKNENTSKYLSAASAKLTSKTAGAMIAAKDGRCKRKTFHRFAATPRRERRKSRQPGKQKTHPHRHIANASRSPPPSDGAASTTRTLTDWRGSAAAWAAPGLAWNLRRTARQKLSPQVALASLSLYLDLSRAALGLAPCTAFLLGRSRSCSGLPRLWQPAQARSSCRMVRSL